MKNSKSSYVVRAQRFIRQIYDYIADCTTPEEFCDAIDIFNKENHRKVDVSWGATRIVLITSDYVIKIDYDREQIQEWGGCADEYRFYQYAEDCGYEYLFAAIEPYEYGDKTFYIMPRIYGIGHLSGYATDYLSDNEYNFVVNHVNDLHDENFGIKNKHIIIIDYAAAA